MNMKGNWSILSKIPKGLGLVSAAVIVRRIPALQCVLRAGADPNTPDGVGCNALQVACFDGDDERRLCIVRELLKWGANPNLRGGPYGSALHTAAKEGHTNLFTTLLAAAPATLNLVNEQGLTPLGTATSFGRHKAVTCLLSLGASDRQVFQETRSGSLQEAVVAGHDTLLSLLLGKGLEAVGGLDSIPDAMGCAVTKSRTRTLNLLLSVEGEERRTFWARTRVSDDYSGKCMLHFAAEFTSLSARSSCSSRPGRTKQRWISMEHFRGMSSGQPNRNSVLQRRGTQQRKRPSPGC
ncbi:conserved unknown protein [Ectocarpus siliculosus]|uniref:Uncharacterized protein n=1 Tax=Ectocarpus siliculosus TaxID=2880 RepID=D8LME7_ECTSI|nr:conserved unknown protein [Ectocarpus siliculosus]|eukprot:CBN77557.1 conserved unknown protein [Ectocarpus siliculosus]